MHLPAVADEPGKSGLACCGRPGDQCLAYQQVADAGPALVLAEAPQAEPQPAGAQQGWQPRALIECVAGLQKPPGPAALAHLAGARADIPESVQVHPHQYDHLLSARQT